MEPAEKYAGCDEIVKFYQRMDVPGKERKGIFGGQVVEWRMRHEGRDTKVRCACTPTLLGFGHLTVSPAVGRGDCYSWYFRGKAIVGTEGDFGLITPFGKGKPKKGKLPIPEKWSDC